jgi:outer membrane protein assembly factor BamB
MIAAVGLLAVCAADWPAWRGPDRSGVSKETGLLKEWPKEGPPLAWTFEDAGTGFSPPAVVGGRLYLLGARAPDGKTVEQIICLDDKGKEQWKAPIAPVYDWDGNQWSRGPNGAPAVDGGLVFALGSQGTLVCVEADGGKEKWRKDLPKEMAAEVSPGPGGPEKIGWGYSWSPLVDGDRLVITPGGGQGLFAALNKTDGTPLWRSKAVQDPCTYSSPVVLEVGGVRQYVALTQDGAVAVAAKDGARLWEYRRDKPFPDVVCPTPLVKDNFVYLTAWGGGGTLLKVTGDGNNFKADAVYTEKEIAPHHGGVVLVDGFVFGNHDLGSWECQDFATGAVKWKSKARALASGSLIAADGRLYCLTDAGEVAMLAATPDAFKELGRFALPKQSKKRQPSGKVWSHPVLSDGRLYLRDQEYVFCYKVAP